MNKLAKIFLSIVVTVAILLTVTSTALACKVLCCLINNPDFCTCCSEMPTMGQETVADPSPMLVWKTLMDPTTEKMPVGTLPDVTQRVLMFNSNEYEVRASGSVFMLIPQTTVKIRSNVMPK